MVARLNGVQEAAGSTPVTRIQTAEKLISLRFLLFFAENHCTLDFDSKIYESGVQKNMAKISMKMSVSVSETFEDFILSRKAKGLSEKTLATYQQHFSAIGKHLSTDIPVDELCKEDLERMIAKMRDASLSSNSIRSYTRTLKSFFSWCNAEGVTRLNIPLYKAEETVKETYSDAELVRLLKKPNLRKCRFPEYRN